MNFNQILTTTSVSSSLGKDACNLICKGVEGDYVSACVDICLIIGLVKTYSNIMIVEHKHL